MPVSVENQPLFDSLVEEVNRVKHRQKEIDIEKSSVVEELNAEKKANGETLKALNILILRMGGTVSSNGKKKKRRIWPRDLPKPTNCLLPRRLHNGTQDITVKSYGLCAGHAIREREGKLTAEEMNLFQEALRRRGVIE